MRPLPARRLLAVLLACMPLAVVADPIGYTSGFNELYRIDLANGAAARIGPASAIGFNDVEGMAFSASGVLFAAVDQSMQIGGGSSATTDFLIRIDPTTGVGSLVAQFPGLQGQGTGSFDNLDYGLAFTCDGRLWLAAETTANLWEVDPGTASLRLVGNLGAPVSGLAARGNTLYGVSVDPTPRLFTIDTDSAVATVIGPLGVGGTVANVGLDFDAAGVLWATLDPGAGGTSRLVSIDPVTGAGTVVGDISVNTVPMKALAIAPTGGCAGLASGPTPVPGPSPWWLAVLATLAVATGIRRRPAG